MATQKYRAPSSFLWKVSDTLPSGAEIFVKAVHLCRAQGRNETEAYQALEAKVRQFGANAALECRTEPGLRSMGVEACGRAAVVGVPAITGKTKEELTAGFTQPPLASATEERNQGKRWQVVGCMIVAGLLVAMMGVLVIMWLLGLVA